EKLRDKTYLDYIGTRPRVERNGSAHGLFSDNDTPINMDAERERLNRHDGTVHTLIISLSREDAEATGFNCAARWRSFIRSQKTALARQFDIPPESLRWYGAFHNEGSHPHIHVLLYSDDPEYPGYLKRRGLEQIKRDFATEIFRHELDSIYETQTKQRDELTQIARDEIKDLVAEMRSGYEIDPELARRMCELSEKLKTVKRKKVYGYLPPEVKKQVNEIVDLLAEDERVKRLYDLWYESRTAILKSYTKHIPPQKPLSGEETFKPIRNAVIREAMKIGEVQQSEEARRFIRPQNMMKQSAFMAVANVFAYAAGIFDSRVSGQLNLHPELSVDSKVRREQWAKDHAVNLTM
ncbi:MAG: hypothetical protein IKX19_00435, partial [Clostridia bacterium]|nr:hypothetical protein [Clostridia bacterium]